MNNSVSVSSKWSTICKLLHIVKTLTVDTGLTALAFSTYFNEKVCFVLYLQILPHFFPVFLHHSSHLHFLHLLSPLFLLSLYLKLRHSSNHFPNLHLSMLFL